MKRALQICIIIIAVTGCASRENLEFSLDTWLGHDVNGLVEYWGSPSNVHHSSNGGLSYTWLFDNGIANAPIDGTVNAAAIYCIVTIDVADNKIIKAWEIEGNDCKV